MLFNNKTFNPNPFLLGSNDYYNDYDDDNIYSLTESNKNLINYRNSYISGMDKEKRDKDNYLTFRNKLEELNNTKKEAILELYNMHKNYQNQKKIQTINFISDLDNILKKKKNEELKKENYLKQLELEINHEKEKNKKLMEAKHIRKKAKQNEMIKKMEKESNIKLLNYKKAKEIEKEEKLKQYELEKKNFENEGEIEINNLKIKSEIADKLFVLFKNKYI